MVFHRSRRGSRIVRIAPSHYLQHRRHVRHVPRKRPDTVQRRRKRNQSIPRNAPVTSHHRRNAAKRSRLPDGSARIRSKRSHRQIRRHRRRRSATRATRHSARRRRILHWPIGRILVGAPHRELIAIRLAQNHRARRFQSANRRRVVRWNVIVQNLRTTGSPHPARADHILHRNRHTSQRRQLLARRHRRVNLVRLRVRPLFAQRQICIQLPIPRRNPFKVLRRQLPRRNLLRRDRCLHALNCPTRRHPLSEFFESVPLPHLPHLLPLPHLSITFGTRKYGGSGSGACFNMSAATAHGTTTS